MKGETYHHPTDMITIAKLLGLGPNELELAGEWGKLRSEKNKEELDDPMLTHHQKQKIKKKQKQRKFIPIEVDVYKKGFEDLSTKGKIRLLLIWALQASNESDQEIKGLRELLLAR